MEGIYGIYHIIYIVLAIITTLILLKYCNKIKNEEKLFKITGIILLLFISINRITITIHNMNNSEGYTLLNLIPNTFCGVTSLVYALTLIFGKKDNIVFHCVSYIGFIGGLLTIIYPTFLSSQNFWDIRSITGLLHHTICVIVFPLLLKTKYFIPKLKKWYVTPIGLSFYMTFGVFELDALNFPKAMQIKEPLIEGVEITSWYYVGILVILLEILFSFLYERYSRGKNINEQ